MYIWFLCANSGVMPKKNTPPSKNSINNNPSSTSKRKSLSAAIMMTAGVLSSNLGYSQSSNPSFLKDTKNTSTELVEKNDSIEHQKIITRNIDDILTEYGEQKGLEIINYHFMIEINKLRTSPVDTSNEIQASAQKQAEFLNQLWYVKHMSWEQSLYNRLKKEGIVFSTCWENLADGQTYITQLINDRLTSKWHTYNLTNKSLKKIWLWHKNKKRVYIGIG